MGAFSDRMTATARRLLSPPANYNDQKYGQAISCGRILAGEYNPVTGEVDTSSTSSYSGYGYLSNYNQNQIDGTIIQQDDILLILSTATEPKLDDTMATAAKIYTAIAIQKITAQGNNVIYKVQLRQ